MGIRIAEEAARQGAEVTLVCGPSSVVCAPFVKRIDVVSAQQMYEATLPLFAETDIAILSAAVADYRPKHVASQKLKKKDAALSIELEPTPDILASLGKIKRSGQILVGFALETENALANAMEKLSRKNCDLIVMNTLSDEGAGFGHDTNRVTIIGTQGNVTNFGLRSKAEVAVDVLHQISLIL